VLAASALDAFVLAAFTLDAFVLAASALDAFVLAAFTLDAFVLAAFMLTASALDVGEMTADTLGASVSLLVRELRFMGIANRVKRQAVALGFRRMACSFLSSDFLATKCASFLEFQMV